MKPYSWQQWVLIIFLAPLIPELVLGYLFGVVGYYAGFFGTVYIFYKKQQPATTKQ
jgi:hypothetical protein